ncbi:MAG: hypothetical protein JRI66_09165 [Deltaproteobacteria bacterium]|nr:hypothetical protein [Deltaproteobacteria bacterium]
MAENLFVYRGVPFPSDRTHFALSYTPVYDGSGRVAKYHELRITAEVYLHPGDLGGNAGEDFTGKQLHELRSGLTEPGGPLTIHSRLIPGPVCPLNDDNLEYYIITNENCIDYGPQPQNVQVEYIGWAKMVYVRWEVVAYIWIRYPDRREGLGIVEYVLNTSYNVDEMGMTTRTLNGRLEIIGRWEANGPAHNAYEYVKYVYYPPEPMFYRSQSYQVSPDGRVLTFTIVDREIPSDEPYPYGVAYIDARLSLEGHGADLKANRNAAASRDDWGGIPYTGVSIPWSWSLSGTLRMVPGVSKRIGYLTIIRLLESKAALMKKGFANQGNQSIALCKGMSFSESIYGREMSFSFDFTITCTVDSIVYASGLFQPIQPSGKWQDWATLMNNLYSPRSGPGFRHLSLNPDSLTVIQLGGAQVPGNTMATPSEWYPQPWHPQGPPLGQLPPAHMSWMRYDVEITIYRKGQTIRVIPVGVGESHQRVTVDLEEKSIPFLIRRLEGVEQGGVVERGASEIYMEVRGVARRVGHRINTDEMPKVLTIAGQPAKMVGEKISNNTMIRKLPAGFPVFEMTSSRTYVVPDPSGKIVLDF